MSRGKLKPEDDDCIQTNYIFLKRELDALEIVDFLYQHNVITSDEKDVIYSKHSKMIRNETLLKLLQNAGPGNAFNYFLKSLEKKYPHVLEKLRPSASGATDYGEDTPFKSLNRRFEPSGESKSGGVGEKVKWFSKLHYSPNQSTLNKDIKSTQAKKFVSDGNSCSAKVVKRRQQVVDAQKEKQVYPSDEMSQKPDLVKGVTKGMSKLTSTIKRSFQEYKNIYWSKDIDLLLLGKTGNGKSASGNSILQNMHAFITFDSVTSVTKDIQYSHSEFEARRIKVVDGPGFEDTGHLYDLEKEKHELIHKMEDAVNKHQDGYHAVLFVLKYGGRFTNEDKNVIEIIKSIFGEDIIKHYCILLMTHGDIFEQNNPPTDITFQQWCFNQEGVFKDLMNECENRIVLFDNRTRNVDKQKAQLKTLITMVDNLQSKGRRYDSSHFKAAKQNRKHLLVTVKHPRIYAEVIKECEIIQNKIQDLSDHSTVDDAQKLESLSIRAQEIDSLVQVEDEETGALKDILKITGTLCKLIHNLKPTIATRLRESELELKFDSLNKLHEIEMEEIKKQKKKIEEENIKLKAMKRTNAQEIWEKREKEIEIKIEETNHNSEDEKRELKRQLDELKTKTAQERAVSSKYLEQIAQLTSSLQSAEENKEKALDILKTDLRTVQLAAKNEYEALQKQSNEEIIKMNEEFQLKMTLLNENYSQTLRESLQVQADLRNELQQKEEQHKMEFIQFKQMNTILRTEYVKRFSQANSKCSIM